MAVIDLSFKEGCRMEDTAENVGTPFLYRCDSILDAETKYIQSGWQRERGGKTL